MDRRTADELGDRCRAVLEANWLGRATKPAPRLYPHQWSWDSAFIAIGNRHHRWDRATLELRTLFQAQWPNGMVPHIVFDRDRSEDDYFPSAGYWDVRNVVSPPPPMASSGICQPPVHATAVRLVVESAPSPEQGKSFAREMVPKLAAWHEYLHSARAIDGPLVEVWHPWETGLDNSPAWDGPLARLQFTSDEVPPYRRVDTTHADAAVRPSNTDYDRYAYLVGRLRRESYEPADPRSLPFRVRDVLFNSVLARSELDLAWLLELTGGDGAERRQRSLAIVAAIDADLWDEASGWYLSEDAIRGELLHSRTVSGLMPLLAGRPSDERVMRLLQTLDEEFLVPVADRGTALLSTGRSEPTFDPIRYWRGPAWVNTTWLAVDALRRVGEIDRGRQLQRGLIHLVDRVGMFEYFDPAETTGHGSDDFSWTAALTLDLLADRTGK